MLEFPSITVSARITDADTAPNAGNVRFTSPSGQFVDANVYESAYIGTAQDGTYQPTMTVPKAYDNGTCRSAARGYGKTPSFIRNAHRDVGIDLDWSERPVFEWKLLGGKSGQEIATGQWFAIYNTRAHECLLEFDRTVGGDIGWPSSQSWGDQLEDRIRDAVEDHWKEAVVALLAL
jgi:hypothetical protein